MNPTHTPYSRPQPGSRGWSVYDAHDEKTHGPTDASWLAEQRTLPLNYRDHEKRRSWLDVDPTSPIAPAIRRLTHLRRNFMRRMNLSEGLFNSRHGGLTTSSSSSSVVSGDTVRFVLLCSLWYMSSALSSNTGKVILNKFRYPVTLTFVQFGFVAAYCLLFMSPLVRFSTMRKPTKAILQSTLPMGFFQVGGHIFSSMAISRIPVSTVHTIKALSPLFTVAAYALLFGVSYSTKTYFSLLPLTLGVMLACSFDMSASNAIGLLCAFGSAIVFVTSNIFFKKIMPSNSNSSNTGHKLDKVNLLFYSSSMAFLLMVPIWIYSDLPSLMSHTHKHVDDHHSHPAFSTLMNFFINGTVHFLQNVLAFVLLAQTSPVTYSIASLIKRVAVICIAVVWFRQHVHLIQGLGIGLTFVGLWCYHGAKGDVEKGEKKVRRVENAREGMLPITRSEVESETEEKVKVSVQSTGIPTPSIYSRPRANSTLHHSHVPQPMVSHTTRLPPPRQTPTYSQTHPHVQPNLQVQTNTYGSHTSHPHHPAVSQVISAKPDIPGSTTSPIDSYPSPPPSDTASPPSSPELEGQEHRDHHGLLAGSEKMLTGDKGRRATIGAGHAAQGSHVPHGHGRKRMGSVARAGIAVGA
ncbi:hypothetical protein QCA50_009032 [Cerrena zonata]|uniref:Sugar phosphate transporter domain-containing protein n=1 Tax=Cerrena zonata TaxID=2478898 RepID=A0AAW0GCZ0_9APHY